MKGKRIVGYAALAIVVLLVAVGMYAVLYGWPPIIRSAAYRSLISDFARADPREKLQRTPRPEPAAWKFDVRLAGGVVAKVAARDAPDVVRVQYSDEHQPRRLYEYEDYAVPVALRTNGTQLYAYWERTLFRTDYWLLVFDLAKRREVQRRKVDPRDMPPIQRR